MFCRSCISLPHREVKTLANNKNGWKGFTAAVCSTAKSDRIGKNYEYNDEDGDDEYYVNIRRFKSPIILTGVDCLKLRTFQMV